MHAHAASRMSDLHKAGHRGPTLGKALGSDLLDLSEARGYGLLGQHEADSVHVFLCVAALLLAEFLGQSASDMCLASV